MNNENPKRDHSRSGISAIILAAGSSHRIGSPKQLLLLGEKTMLERAIAIARNAKVDEIVLVLGAAAAEIQQKVSTEGLTVVINEGYQQGMGTSLRVGLASVNSNASGALVMLADQPFVRPATLDCMIECQQRQRAQIVIPTYNGFRGNPVLLHYSVFPELANLKGDIGCRAIFGSHVEGIHRLPVNDPGIFLDVDTLDDFHKLQALLQSGKTAAELLPKEDVELAENGERNESHPELVVVGRDPVAISLVRVASLLHFSPAVLDPFLTLKDLPEADRIVHRLDFSLLPKNRERYIVIASRGQFDEEALEQALLSEAAYVGMMAGRSRCEELKATMKKKGVPEEKLRQLHAPAGLEIGAEGPEEIALSIISEIVSERRRRA